MQTSADRHFTRYRSVERFPSSGNFVANKWTQETQLISIEFDVYMLLNYCDINPYSLRNTEHSQILGKPPYFKFSRTAQFGQALCDYDIKNLFQRHVIYICTLQWFSADEHQHFSISSLVVSASAQCVKCFLPRQHPQPVSGDHGPNLVKYLEHALCPTKNRCETPSAKLHMYIIFEWSNMHVTFTAFDPESKACFKKETPNKPAVSHSFLYATSFTLQRRNRSAWRT